MFEPILRINYSALLVLTVPRDGLLDLLVRIAAAIQER